MKSNITVKIILLSIIAGVLIVVGFTIKNREKGQERINILILMSDNHSWNHLGSYGDPVVKTPNIDTLAKQGIIFKNAFCVDKILKFTKGMTFPEFRENELVSDAVIRNFEVIGEASKNIPDIVKKKYPKIPWRQMYGLRNFVVHNILGLIMKLSGRSFLKIFQMIK